MPEPSVQTFRCPACGAPAAADASRCDYCHARLATASCPSCFGLLFDGADFCQHCGARRERVEPGGDGTSKCPACKGAMRWVRVGTTDLLECEGCDGTWVEADTFERLCAEREAQAAVLHNADSATVKSSAGAKVSYRACPRCAKLMNRMNFGRASGAIVDVCKGHGTFLDRGELHQIVRFIQGGGMERLRESQREELLEEQRKLQEMLRELGRKDRL